MKFVKGQSGNPHGKPKGPNKSTRLAREAITLFIDNNADKLQGWLDDIAEKEGPKAAFNCFTDLIEFSVPKLSRSDVNIGGQPNNPVVQEIRLVGGKDGNG